MADHPGDPTAAAALRWLQARHRELRKIIDGVSDEGLNWRPGADTSSIYSVLIHTLDSERQVLSTATGAPEAIQTDHAVRGTAADLLERLAQADADLVRYLPSVTDMAPEVPLYGRPMSVAMCLTIQVGHTSEHMAHAALTRQLWDQYGSKGLLAGAEA
ncbi:MAG: DinB family protein [Chloroflexi bacterium]|nr:DinB family protein [Chloroflexota bacterium]